MNYKEIYKSKIRTLQGALELIKSNDFIFTAQAASEPITLLHNLHSIREKGIRGCDLTNCFPVENYEFIKNPLYKDTICVNGWFYTAPLRKSHCNGNVSLVPQHAHSALKKRIFASERRRLVLLCTCSPMDKHGFLTLSLSSVYERELIDMGALVIAEVNSNFPRTFGDTTVHISEISALVETNYAVPSIPPASYTEVDKKIGEYIADLVENGSTLQLGIGKTPNAVANELKNKKYLGIHTEMFTDSMADLIECGAIDNSMKSLYKGKSIGCFAFGSERLYKFIDDNPSFIFKPASWANSPYVIGQNSKMVSINTSLEVDLTGQCASESIGAMQYSCTGGQADTAIGAQMSKGGKSIIALHSTIEITDNDGNKKLISKISPLLKEGTIISLSRNDVDYVVTEYGVAWLRGRSVKERVERLINIAHPSFRDELRYATKEIMIW